MEKQKSSLQKLIKKFNLAGEEILSAKELKNLRRLLQETFNVAVKFVDLPAAALLYRVAFY
ncbi:hypothetical protein SAMN05421682_108167 [Chryseobacterium indoltheticum]|uniref:Uncharacterized protein n=1 Tax=Chryseobacterium indoltheticum TaxID=254 RepID=A0A381F6X5_9FLAO|nr:hypothetical protein SAMN05421682_108167 [Chryseobacterium indoltheticum]SUX42285.1 Uncharacterised protein [Chryseobacterium indoltheticum]